jgi:hypothetical protein
MIYGYGATDHVYWFSHAKSRLRSMDLSFEAELARCANSPRKKMRRVLAWYGSVQTSRIVTGSHYVAFLHNDISLNCFPVSWSGVDVSSDLHYENDNHYNRMNLENLGNCNKERFFLNVSTNKTYFC